MTPDYKDYYKIMGVEKSATEKEIKVAYRKLAAKYQVGANTGDKSAEDKLKEVNEAKEVLLDKDKRTKYDQYGAQWKAASQSGFPSGGGFPGGTGTNSPGGFRVQYGGGGTGQEGFPDLNDLFSTLFGDNIGGGSRMSDRFASPFGRQTQTRGQDIEANVAISLEEAFAGTIRNLTLTLPGRYDLEQNVREQATRRVEVKIPAGVADSQKIRLAGQGEPGQAGNGDLFLIVQVQPNTNFERRGDDLYTDIDVPYTRAALGGDVSVPTLRGQRLTMTLPSGTSSGRALRLGGQGMPRLRGEGSGDLYARVRVTVPKTLTERERELLTELSGMTAIESEKSKEK